MPCLCQLLTDYSLDGTLSRTRKMLNLRVDNTSGGTGPWGVADLRAIRQAVEEGATYDGFCEVEIFSARDWWTRDPAQVLDVIAGRFRQCC